MVGPDFFFLMELVQQIHPGNFIKDSRQANLSEIKLDFADLIHFFRLKDTLVRGKYIVYLVVVVAEFLKEPDKPSLLINPVLDELADEVCFQ